jgi:hypothetical protein
VIPETADQGTVAIQKFDDLGGMVGKLGSCKWCSEKEDPLNEALAVLVEDFLIVFLGSNPVVFIMKGVDKSLERIRNVNKESVRYERPPTWQVTRPPRLWQAKYIGRSEPCMTCEPMPSRLICQGGISVRTSGRSVLIWMRRFSAAFSIVVVADQLLRAFAWYPIVENLPRSLGPSGSFSSQGRSLMSVGKKSRGHICG